MKRYYVLFVFCTLVLNSCTTDDNTIEAEASQNTGSLQLAHKDAVIVKNTSNPYDAAGDLYVKVRDIAPYVVPGTSVTQITVDVNDAATKVLTATYPGYQGVGLNDVTWVVNNYTDTAIINATAASADGKTKIAELLVLAQSLTNKSFSSVYAQLTSFENAVLSDNKLNDLDRKIVLTAAAVARYQSCDNGDEDKYWIKKRPAILGAINGAGAGVAQALTMAMATEMSH